MRSTDGGMRAREVIPLRKSAPELFRAAQSSGLCPGARTTFCRSLTLDNDGGFLVVGGGIRDDADDGAGRPGRRGNGIDDGGGMRVDDDVGCDEGDGIAEERRCALSIAGKAGGESSSTICVDMEGFVGVVGDSSSSVDAELLCCKGRVGNHERR